VSAQEPPTPRPGAPPTPAGPPPDAPLEARDPYEPATVEDLRTLRRWLAVVGIWAVAASAVALIALFDTAEEPQTSGDQAETASQISRVQRNLDERLDELEKDVAEGSASREDVARLERRVRRAEGQSADAREDAGRARESSSDLDGRLDDLEDRVQRLEDEQPPP
jgi:septal ring factor EnvC (AmiA/AmiB activator)